MRRAPAFGVISSPPPRPRALHQRQSNPAAPTAPEVKSSPSAENQVIVRRGDTRKRRIANAHKPANASLEQMLVCHARGQSASFIQNNVNKIKSRCGAFYRPPPGCIRIGNRSQTVYGHSGRDFNAFRQRFSHSSLASSRGHQDRKASWHPSRLKSKTPKLPSQHPISSS